ncbi:MAG: nitroreductase family protein [Coriobacteriaceae bacterium]|nr:nitroreductase family protein [Coriobacteriaceae bacterium]
MKCLDLIATRYSVRQYDPKPVEKEKLDKVLEAGRLAPTSWNLQPQRVYVLQSEEAMDKLRAVSPMHFGAPVVLVICYDETQEWHTSLLNDAMPETVDWEDYHTGALDCCFVADHMALEATELGLGTCIIRGFDEKIIHDALGLPETSRIVVMLDLGYEDEFCIESPGHLGGEPQRKDLEETVTFL